ncbi:MAG: type II toxin-antitoxin system VapC family toxin [Defluviitaleaceae bacterium]|nr:type II toxin-antitoxin system VapC family toxin [Defluviitaleaceae bacterium]
MGAVNYLLDTHTLLWAVRDEMKLGKNAFSIIENINNQLFVSAVSVYEIVYKHQLGKLSEYDYFAENFFDIISKLNAKELPLNMNHAHFAAKLKWAHRDPFDRLLAAQAFVENLTLLTNDPMFEELPNITITW